MRQIKFKFWDGIDFMSNPYTLHEILLNQSIQFTKDCIQLQFTGLHDKNGKEIYEGDIVGHKFYSKPVIVSWNNELAMFEAEDISLTGTILEVIGTIYENPEDLQN